MCELLGVTSKDKVVLNDLLDIYFSHSVEHRNGWGLALLDNPSPYIVKEPLTAIESPTVRRLLEQEIATSKCIAHIRKATIGEVDVENTHPFLGRDATGRLWVLAHNGTIFDSDVLGPYQYVQDGSTDSERILLFILDQMSDFFRKRGVAPDADERIEIMDSAIRTIVPGNKVNLMVSDGDLLYVHKNEPGTMYMRESGNGVLFSTQPLSDEGWKSVPRNRLLVYRDETCVYVGDDHDNTRSEEHTSELQSRI